MLDKVMFWANFVNHIETIKKLKKLYIYNFNYYLKIKSDE